MNGSFEYLEKLLFRIEDKIEHRVNRLETFFLLGVGGGVIVFAVERWLGS